MGWAFSFLVKTPLATVPSTVRVPGFQCQLCSGLWLPAETHCSRQGFGLPASAWAQPQLQEADIRRVNEQVKAPLAVFLLSVSFYLSTYICFTNTRVILPWACRHNVINLRPRMHNLNQKELDGVNMCDKLLRLAVFLIAV